MRPRPLFDPLRAAGRFMLATVALTAVLSTAPAAATGPRSIAPDVWQQYAPDGFRAVYYGAALGPDGRMWFTDGGPASSLLRREGGINFSRRALIDGPEQLVVGSDGAFYATLEPFSGGLLRVPLRGAATFIAIADQPYGGLSLGTDGNLWYTATQHVGSVSPSGTVTQYDVRPAHPRGRQFVPFSYGGIAQDNAGHVWFGVRELGGPSYVGSLDPATGLTKLYAAGSCAPDGGFALGPDGAVWFQCVSVGLARAVSGRPIETYPMPAGLYPAWPQGLAFDSKGNLWSGVELVQSGIVVGGSFVEFDLATHRFRRHDLPTSVSWPFSIAFSHDGSLWATTLGESVIVELVRPR